MQINNTLKPKSMSVYKYKIPKILRTIFLTLK